MSDKLAGLSVLLSFKSDVSESLLSEDSQLLLKLLARLLLEFFSLRIFS